MSENIGVSIQQAETSLSVPKVAKTGVVFAVGAAPVHMAKTPAKAGVPVLCASWDEAVEKLGYCEDWARYPLCEVMYSQFQLYGMGPVVLVNVLDPEAEGMTEAVSGKTVTLTEGRGVLAGEVLLQGLEVKAEETPLAEGVDYTAAYVDGALVLEMIPDTEHAEEESLNVTGKKVKPEAVTAETVAAGFAAADHTLTVTPDLLLAPGWSGEDTVAAIMATKAARLGRANRAHALIDLPSGEGGVKTYDQIPDYKSKHSLVDALQVLSWPTLVTLGQRVFHGSTHLAGRIAQTDEANSGVPYESPSNLPMKIDGTCLEDKTPVALTWPQVQLAAGDWGVVVFMNAGESGWVAKGNYTAAYPASTDPVKSFIPMSRMMNYIGNTVANTLWAKLDRPMSIPVIRAMVSTVNDWMEGLTAAGYLYGNRAEVLNDENALTDILAGKIKLHVWSASPPPIQKLDIILEYDVSMVPQFEL